MTKARRDVVLNRYRDYALAWWHLADRHGYVETTFQPLADLIGVARQSVGPALRRMQDLGFIQDLRTHTVHGTSFVLSRNE